MAGCVGLTASTRGKPCGNKLPVPVLKLAVDALRRSCWLGATGGKEKGASSGWHRQHMCVRGCGGCVDGMGVCVCASRDWRARRKFSPWGISALVPFSGRAPTACRISVWGLWGKTQLAQNASSTSTQLQPQLLPAACVEQWWTSEWISGPVEHAQLPHHPPPSIFGNRCLLRGTAAAPCFDRAEEPNEQLTWPWAGDTPLINPGPTRRGATTLWLAPCGRAWIAKHSSLLPCCCSPSPPSPFPIPSSPSGAGRAFKHSAHARSPWLQLDTPTSPSTARA